MKIHEFYISFGVQYSGRPTGTPHPLGMHKDGYAVIEAPDLEMARRIARAIFADKFAFIYPKSDFIDDGTAARWHHAGELLRIKWVVPHNGGIVPPHITDKIKGHEGDQP
jgi:hypothetical protein